MTDLQARYGTRTRPRWLLPAVAAIALALAVGWVVWVATADKPFHAKVFSYDVVNDHQTTIRLDIHRPKPVALECTVYAQAEDHSIVGERTVTTSENSPSSLRMTVAVQTERRAVTGVLKSCMVLRAASSGAK